MVMFSERTAQYTNGWETDIIRNFLNGGPISWFSRLQKLVALSTAESEIYATIDEVKIIAHLKILLNDLGARDLSPVTTYQDQACIQMGSQ
jgi:hypothetical protein